MTDDRLEILSRETVYHGFFRIDRYRLRHRRHAGGWSAPQLREVFERGRAVGVLLYDPARDAVVLVEQFRLPAQLGGFDGFQLEIVAGIMDHEGESEAAVGRREVREEAGLAIAGALIPIHRYLPSPGGSTEIVDLFCGIVDSRGAGGIHGLAAEHEDIKVHVLDYRTVIRRLAADGFQNGPTITALYWLRLHRPRLRRQHRGRGA